MTNFIKLQILNPKSQTSTKSQFLKQDVFRNLNLRILNLFRISCLGFWIFSLCASSFAATFMESFLKDGVGVRPLGMGGAFVALSEDSNSVFYNPAALADAKIQYTQGYMDMNTDFYNANDCWAISFSQGGLGSWNRADKSGNKATATAFSFGTKGASGVAWGVTYKNVAWDLSGSQDRGWALDAGLKAPLTKEINAGILVQDFVKNNVPASSSVILGFSLAPAILTNTYFVVDSEFRNLKAVNGADIYLHYGAESKIAEGLILRAGWQKDLYSAGATANFPYVTIDYAVILNPGKENTQMFGFRFGDDKQQ